MAESKDFTLKCPENIFDLNKAPELQTFNTKEFLGMNFDKEAFIAGIKESDLIEKPFVSENQKLKNKTYNWKTMPVINKQSYRKIRSYMISYYEQQFKNCYFSGFFAIMLCSKCESIIDMFPCYEKRIYWITSGLCKYCIGDLKKDISVAFNTERINEKKWKYHHYKIGSV